MTTIDDMLAACRSRLNRVAPEDLPRALENGAVLVDIRDSAQRVAHGPLPGAHEIDLTVLEWRLAPSTATRTLDVAPDQQVILVCREGFSSSLAAVRLQELGLTRATDLIGGYGAWRAHVEG